MLSLAALVPHGDEILLPEDPESKKLNDAMKKLGNLISSKNIDEYVFVTPHNLRIDTHIGIISTQYLHGSWVYKNVKIDKRIKCDRILAETIYKRAHYEKLPVIKINYGALEGELSSMCLDWGTLIPMYFLPPRTTVLITPARNVRKTSLIKFGKIIGETIKNNSKNIALIISADHAHAHKIDGPYGYHKDAKKYDQFIMNNLNDLKKISTLNPKILKNAKPDSYWQLLILEGVLETSNLHLVEKVYARPSYFGMAVAWYTSAAGRN